MQLLLPRSSVSGIDWPAIPSAGAATALAMQYQLEQSQWWSPEALQAMQLRQLSQLLAHAYETVPFYRERLGAASFDSAQGITPEQFDRLPLLSRQDVQRAGKSLLSDRVPQDHGKTLGGNTSGSTGRPITFYATELTQFFWRALTLREHLWHGRDFNGMLANIRVTGGEGKRVQGWGPSTDAAFETGPSATLDIRAGLATQLEWLQHQNPDYLLTYPSNVHGLAKLSMLRGLQFPKLREVRTISENLNPEVRELCRKAWGVPLVDTYSAAEVGYIALQCPQHEHYHVQSETVLVEILNPEGRSCLPGEIGRVVITTLHNFAMPLIRYEIMDYAEVGDPCPCGRGLPVIARILGRQRSLVTLPDGSQHWPRIGQSRWMDIVPIEQIQLVQKTPHHVEAKLVMSRRLQPEEESKLTLIFQESLGYPFLITYSYPAEIMRNASGKFEDFVSEVDAGAATP